ncbi:MAG: co-chaperone GroES, partial [Deltaproteobacteria bacterium]|nr:co-chaperone GroES [Deltaproteobacteria bacterium]
MVNIQPLSGNVLIEQVNAESVSAGGIIIPDAAKERPSQGVIVALAADATDEV